MYKFVLISLEEKDVIHNNIFLNLERKMKCGVGKCGHCQMNDKYVCMEGPVFRYSDLATVPEAI
jgi:NAD(P)H-flavin reductase